MILKEYQKQTLATVRSFLEQLAVWREKDAAARSQDSEWRFDWVQRAWGKTVAGRPYHPRRNGLGEQLPAFCLKIPTGGGKTLLATRVIDLVNAQFRQSRRGLVLWIVPTTQIYNQTLRALKDRDHPYRQQLDLSSGQRTRIFEKTMAFGPRDVAENLCILLLMLPSANRRTKDTLRMFRDSGGFDRFFPPDDDPAAHAKLLEEHPNLDTFEQTTGVLGPLHQDIPREHRAAAATADYPRRGTQGLQRQREGNARRVQPLHDRRTFGHSGQRCQRARRDPGPGTQR